MSTQICMLHIALTKIAYYRTYVQWFWLRVCLFVCLHAWVVRRAGALSFRVVYVCNTVAHQRYHSHTYIKANAMVNICAPPSSHPSTVFIFDFIE